METEGVRGRRPSRGEVGKKSVFVKPLFLLNATQHYSLDLQEIEERKYMPDTADVYFIDDGLLLLLQNLLPIIKTVG